MEKKSEFKVWITRYVLTRGIVVAMAQATAYPSMISVVSVGGKEVPFHRRLLVHEPYWYTDEESAKAHAREMVKKRIVALKKKTKELNKLLVDLG
jgi:hypothetical protein